MKPDDLKKGFRGMINSMVNLAGEKHFKVVRRLKGHPDEQELKAQVRSAIDLTLKRLERLRGEAEKPFTQRVIENEIAEGNIERVWVDGVEYLQLTPKGRLSLPPDTDTTQ
jgi:hypothetical protein